MDNDDIMFDITDMSTITIDSLSTITIDSSISTHSYGDDWISINDINLDSITTTQPVEFEDCMPDVAKVEDMCRDYPALEKAYENFKTIYKLVHQDWQGRQDAES